MDKLSGLIEISLPVVETMRRFCAIDYQIATPGIAASARTAAVYKERRFSDHAPLTIDYDVGF